MKPEPLQPTHYDDLRPGHADWIPWGEFGTNPDSWVFDHLQTEQAPDQAESPILTVRRLLGDHRTLRFWRWADEHGKRTDRSWQRQVYLPKVARRNHWVTYVIGWEGAKVICSHFEGKTLDIPNINFASRKQARRYALILQERGLNPSQIAKEISLDWKITTKTVKKMLQDHPED